MTPGAPPDAPSTASQNGTADRLTLEELEHHIVAAALADTEVLEQVNARYAQRLSPRLSSLFRAAAGYFSITRGTMNRQALASILATNEPDTTKHQDYLALFDELTSPPYDSSTPEERRWYLHQFDTEWRINETGRTLARAAEALRHGYTSHNNTLTGADAAWRLLAEERLRFDQLAQSNTTQEVELTSTTEQAKLDYESAANADLLGVPLRLPEVNNLCFGLRPGDFLLWAGYANEGKSFLLLNDDHEAFVHGKNVSFASGEMNVRKNRPRFIALHSKWLFDKGILPKPLETKKIDRGTLDPEEKEIFNHVLEDIRTNPEYGKFWLWSFPRRATPSLLFNRFAAHDQVVPIDKVTIDYLGLMTSERARVSRREELDDLLREVKGMALDFADGRGVAISGGYQTNRASFEQARRDGYYTLSCFAESSEAEKSADLAVWLLSLPQNLTELKCGVVKNRDDEKGEPFHIAQRFKYAQVESLKSSRGTGPDSVDALLNL